MGARAGERGREKWRNWMGERGKVEEDEEEAERRMIGRRVGVERVTKM